VSQNEDKPAVLSAGLCKSPGKTHLVLKDNSSDLVRAVMNVILCTGSNQLVCVPSFELLSKNSPVNRTSVKYSANPVHAIAAH
jgi:hypothetical protein